MRSEVVPHSLGVAALQTDAELAQPPTGHLVQESGFVVDDSHHPLRARAVPLLTLKILVKLRSTGHESFIMGQAVRDLMNGRTVTRLDLLTSATPGQVQNLFKRTSQTRGRTGPVVRVSGHEADHAIHSFAQSRDLPHDVQHLMKNYSERASEPAASWSNARKQNTLQHTSDADRLLYDPCSGILYDYSGAVPSGGSAGSAALDDSRHPIRPHDIPLNVLSILVDLRRAGHESYLVGGAVRDLLLGRTPKDHDLLSSASLSEVKKLTKQSFKVGKRHPIVHVRRGPTIHEVSSFETNMEAENVPRDAGALMADKTTGKRTKRCPLWSTARGENAAARDFTINALMYDPFSGLLYDYMGGVADCQQRVLRCIGEPVASFEDDPARMLRAVRHAGRAGLALDAAVIDAIQLMRDNLQDLNAGRFMLEMQGMMGYGGAEGSMQLLWKLGLLPMVFPAHARYLADCYRDRALTLGDPEMGEPLFEALRCLDSYVSPTTSLDPSVWDIHIPARVLEVIREQAHATADRLPPSIPQVVVSSGSGRGRTRVRQKRLPEFMIVARVLQCPSLRWQELTRQRP
ncbi:hypothetical protein WJX73_003709 [Symbiochloris irregularis]|uniref:Poly(A) polymerase n=1 Tax=Symbiochloris irregularis TaxID=706552 RepID=A0AAW1NLI8_9CHLO